MPKKVISLVVGLVVVVVLSWAIFNTFENLSAGDYMFVQSPLKGNLKWCTAQGVYWQGFGKVTKYPIRSQFWFSMASDQGKKDDQSISVRFNDGGSGRISGSLAWEMPADIMHATALHKKYGSSRAIEHDLIRTLVEKAVYMTGPLMSSQESYAARRNELLNLIDDQITHGVFKTKTEQEKQKDAMTGYEKTVSVVKLVTDKEGNALRQDSSPLQEFGIRTFNLSINKIPYDKVVEDQIKLQQEAIMNVQTAIANAKKAEQDAITAEKNGQANAATEKWKQEAIKAKFVTEAEQKRDVAKLEKDAAEFVKAKLILEGTGESEKRRLIMAADGGLEIKLKTFESVQGRWAQEMSKQKWVPEVVMGGDGSQHGGNNIMAMVNLMTMQALKALGLDISVPTGRTVQAPAGKK